jgi:DNA-binding IclR family transcriptional regulator
VDEVDDDRSGKSIATLTGTQTLERGLALIAHVVEAPVTIQQLSADAGLTLSVTRRLVAGLVNQGFLTIGSDRRLRGGAQLIRLGVQAQGQLDIVSVARPFLTSLAEATSMSSFLGERSGDHSIHLLRSPGSHRVVVSTPVGTRRALAETSLGKALLLDEPDEWPRIFAAAEPRFVDPDWRTAMEQARSEGVVLHASPPPDNFRAVAAPVRNAANEIVAAISVVTLAQYADADVLDRTKHLVRDHARQVSESLGALPNGRS